jgi:hypothetical protein
VALLEHVTIYRKESIKSNLYSRICYEYITWLNTDGISTGDGINWTFLYSSWLRFIVYCYTHTHISVHSHVFTVVAWYWLPTVDVPFLRVPCHQPQLSGSNSNDWTSSVLFTNWHKLLTCRAYNISTRIAQKTPSLCCCEIVTVELSCSCLLAESLPNKGCYIVVYRNGSTCHNTLNPSSMALQPLWALADFSVP